MKLSFFTTTLQSFLRYDHPHLLGNRDFIRERSEQAARTFEQARYNGEDIPSAIELANRVLFAGLHYSKLALIVNILDKDLPIVPRESQSELALRMLPGCEALFERYDLDLNFEDTPEFGELCSALTETIKYYIHSHGI